jgi:hypothetical protein
MADVRMADARWACLTVERLKEERTPIDPTEVYWMKCAGNWRFSI